MSGSRRLLGSIAIMAVGVAVVISAVVTPVAVAADSTLLEAEAMTVSPPSAGMLVQDATASSGAALTLVATGSASTTVSLPPTASVTVRAKRQECWGTPLMAVSVDGSVGLRVRVTATSWTDYTFDAPLAAGSHAIQIAFAGTTSTRACRLWLDRIVVTSSVATTTSTTPPTTSTNPAPALFNGDYSTGDFMQWTGLQNRNYVGSPSGYAPSYPASVVQDSAKGSVGRYEVRSGDTTAVGGGERSEVYTDASKSGGTEGQVRWYQFSTKFDATFPTNHATLGWGVTNQWHPDSTTGSPPVAWVVNARNGYWSLYIQKQSSPEQYLATYSIFDVPLNVGTWHDVKMEICWSASDTTGYIRLWLNGVRQRFLDGSDTYFVRTMIPATSTVYYKEGYYRQPMKPTGIVYHAGFRTATSEAGLANG